MVVRKRTFPSIRFRAASKSLIDDEDNISPRRWGRYITFKSLTDSELVEFRVKRQLYSNLKIGEHGALSTQGFRIVRFDRPDAQPSLERATLKHRVYAYMIDHIMLSAAVVLVWFLFVTLIESVIAWAVSIIAVDGLDVLTLSLYLWTVVASLVFFFRDIFKGRAPERYFLKLLSGVLLTLRLHRQFGNLL